MIWPHCAFIAARGAYVSAAEEYAKRGRAVAAELARDQDATLADVAWVLFVSRWEAARLMAERPRSASIFDAHWELRHRLREHAVPAVVHVTGTAAGMARIVGTDALREARRRFARRADS